jgi:DNA polymerase elongation subunit (family B)
MIKNIYYDNQNSIVHVWEQINGENFYDNVVWAPFVYLKTNKSVIKTIDGVPVVRKEFDSYRSYNDFQNTNSCYENKVLPVIQFFAERYYEIEDSDIQPPKLEIHYEDIEVFSTGEFPNTIETAWPITLISIAHSKGVQVFGCKKYTPCGAINVDDVTYVKCNDEKDLLERYFTWKRENPCDVMTGWNYCADIKNNPMGGFDLPYIIRRTQKLFGTNTKLYKKLSPIGLVKMWKMDNIDNWNIDIAGVTILDFMSIYKWFTQHNLENHKLDYVARLEKVGAKLDYSDYDTLRNLYNENHDLYVEYNINDSRIVQELEKKLAYIFLIETLCLLCKNPMKNYCSQTQLVEGLLITYYRRNNLCAPEFNGGSQEYFPAAFVKEPNKGLHEWVIDLDITSSYPTAIITLNMSIETYFGRVVGFTKEHLQEFKRETGVHTTGEDGRPFYNIVIQYVRKKQFPPFHILKNTGFEYYEGDKLSKFNKALEHGLLAIAPCGSIFMNKPTGVYAAVVKNIFLKRKVEKGNKFTYKEEAKQEKDPEKKANLVLLSIQKHALQYSLKLIINASFGVTAVPYSRYFNVNISEAITSCGRNTILEGEMFVNRLLNNPNIRPELVGIIEEIKEK